VTRRGITLTVGRAAEVDITMDVGNVAEVVEVTGEAPLVDTTTAVLGGLVEQRAIQDLPLNGRSFMELATLGAGTLISRGGGQSESQGFGQKISISGGRFTSNLFLLDGTVMNDSYNSAGGAADGVAAGVETVREFKVITNSYSAEYGQHTGGVINAVTRGGTNDLHGSIYEFFRNDNLDAYSWDSKANPVVEGKPERAELRRNQFGASLGGPILRDRSFFFGNFEGLRENVGGSRTITIPDERTRQGFLPANATADPNDVGEIDVAARNPEAFAKVKPYFDLLWPFPAADTQLRDQGDGTLEYTRNEGTPSKLNYVSGRVDHKLSDNDSLFGRYTMDHADRENPSYNTVGILRSRNQFATLQYDRIVSPTILNSANVGYTRTFTGLYSISFPGFERVTFSDSEFGHGGVSGTGFSGTGSGSLDPRLFILNNYQAKNDLTINRGSHTFKIGGNFSRLQHNDTSPRQPAGQFSFDTTEDFLLANPEDALISLAENYVRYVRQSIVGMYFQDDWRVFPNFTLNLGLRWEMVTSPKFAAHMKGQMPRALEENFFNPTFGPDDVQLAESLFENPSKDNFAPRVGFAWDLFGDGKTSVRGGAGIFYESLIYWTYRLAILHTAPLFVEGRLLGEFTPGGVDFPNAYFTQRDIFTGDPRYESFQKNPNQPYIGKYSLEIQRQLTPTLMMRVGYSATRGIHLPNMAQQNGRRHSIDANGVMFFPASNPVYNPNFGRTRHRRTHGTSDYHSLRLEVEKRISAGLQFQGNYTWSKNIDEGTSVTGSTDFSNDVSPRNWSIKDRGLSALDQRHVFTLNALYSLPGQSLMGWMGEVLGGWQVSGLARISAGEPFSIVTGFDRGRLIEGTNFPDLKPGEDPYAETSIGCQLQAASPRFPTGVIPAGTPTGTRELWFDPCVYALQPAGYLGTGGRNTMTGPGIFTVDLSFAKTFNLSRVRENTRLEFRGEMFNALNHVNMTPPSGSIFNQTTQRPGTNVARINNARDPRKVQLGLKVTF
jgi:hypothetical protein